MADEEKKYFDEEKQKKAIKWVDDKCGDIKCECCKASQWQLTPEIVAVPVFVNGSMMIGGSISPTFTIVCMNCGNTKFINALIAKVIEPEKAGEEDGKSS